MNVKLKLNQLQTFCVTWMNGVRIKCLEQEGKEPVKDSVLCVYYCFQARDGVEEGCWLVTWLVQWTSAKECIGVSDLKGDRYSLYNAWHFPLLLFQEELLNSQ